MRNEIIVVEEKHPHTEDEDGEKILIVEPVEEGFKHVYANVVKALVGFQVRMEFVLSRGMLIKLVWGTGYRVLGAGAGGFQGFMVSRFHGFSVSVFHCPFCILHFPFHLMPIA